MNIFQSLVLLNIENHNVGKCKHEFATFTIFNIQLKCQKFA